MKKRLALVLVTLGICLLVTPALAMATYASPPVLARFTYAKGTTVKTHSYVTPKTSKLSNKKIYYYVYKRDSDGDYNYNQRFLGELHNSPKYDDSTRASGKLTGLKSGHFKVKAKYMWTDSDGDSHSRSSTFKYFVVENKDYQAPSYVSPPTTKSSTYDVDDSFMLRSYAKPKFHTLAHKKAWYYFYRKDSDGDYQYKMRVAATLYKTDDPNTRLKAKTTVSKGGHYRVRVKFQWQDSDGDTHTRKSTYHYLTIKSSN